MSDEIQLDVPKFLAIQHRYLNSSTFLKSHRRISDIARLHQKESMPVFLLEAARPDSYGIETRSDAHDTFQSEQSLFIETLRQRLLAYDMSLR